MAAATLATVLITPAVASAQVQQAYTVDFAWTPTAPTTADELTLTAVTTAPAVMWDFDGDGAPDARGAQVKHRFETAGDHQVTVKASWPAAVPLERTATRTVTVAALAQATPTATPEATPTPVATASPTPVPCSNTIDSGKLHVTSMLCFDVARSTYTTKYPIALNGIFVGPVGGKTISIDTAAGTIRSDNAKVKVTVNGASTLVSQGKVDWKLSGDVIKGFQAQNVVFSGMKVKSLTQAALLPGGKAKLSAYLTLPAKLGGATSAQPVAIQAGAGAPPVVFSIPKTHIAGLDLFAMTVRSDGDASWSVDAKVQLPQPLNLKVGASVGIRNGAFEHFSSDTSFGSGGPFAGPVHLKRLSFNVEADPFKSKCAPKGTKPAAAMCGNLDITAGPTLLGAPALSLKGGFGLTVFENAPTVLKAGGEVKLVGMTLSNSELTFTGDGYVAVKSKHSLGWPGVATIKGSSSIEFKGSKFNGEGSDQVCLEFIDYCLGAQALISTKGVAACLTVDTWLGDWHPGFGAQWGKTAKLYWSGCDLAPYREAVASAAAASKRVRFERGLPGAVIAVTGTNGAPRVAFVGPHGKRIETPVDNRPVGGKGYFLMKVPGEDLTQIALAKPAAGAWKVVSLDGSAISVKSAEGVRAPSVSAKIKRGRLVTRVVKQAGQTVRFLNNGRPVRNGSRVKPGPVVALVERNGQLRDRIVVRR
jgi:hypothetical protein